MKKTDLTTAIGIFAAMALVGSAIILGGTPMAFFDLRSALIVVGGTFAVTTACFSMPEIFHSQSLILRTVVYHAPDPTRVAHRILELAEVSRKKGVLSLQESFNTERPKNFLEKGLAMIIDGIPPEDVEKVLKQEISSMVERHDKGTSILRKSAEVSPAMGLIGTLIGLIQMLGNLDDPSTIGPAMAVALLTTMYGAMLAYMVFSPLASKLDRNSQEEVLVNTLYLKGILSIGRQENPRRLEMLLNTILPPAKRVRYFK